MSAVMMGIDHRDTCMVVPADWLLACCCAQPNILACSAAMMVGAAQEGGLELGSKAPQAASLNHWDCMFRSSSCLPATEVMPPVQQKTQR
jgi:hypothetical protein